MQCLAGLVNVHNLDCYSRFFRFMHGHCSEPYWMGAHFKVPIITM